MYDLFYIGRKDKQFTRLKTKFLSLKIAEKFEYAQKKATTKFFWCIWSNLLILDDFDFDYVPDAYSQDIPHVFRNTTDWYGVWLCPKNRVISQKEIEHRFLVFHKQVEIDASCYRNYEKYFIDTYDDYLYAMETSQTEMFWMSSNKIKILDNFHLEFYFSYDDQYNRKENHVFLNSVQGDEKFDGLFLLSKHKPVSKREIEHRHLVSRKEWNITVSKERPYEIFTIETYDDYLHALENSKTEMFWGTSDLIDTSNFAFDVYYNYRGNEFEYERKENHAWLNDICGEQKYDGVFLFSKHKPVTEKEINYRHLVSKKEHEVVASTERRYEIFTIETYDDYLYAMEHSKTEMFWGISDKVDTSNFAFDVYYNYRGNEFEYERKENHAFIHRVDNKDYYNGLFLLSKHKPVTEKEINYRHLVSKKEHKVVASYGIQYDVFNVETYDDYLRALENSKTELFWATTPNINTSNFDFSQIYFTHDDEYNRKENHAFIHRVSNKDYYNGLFLFSKHKPVTEREIQYRHLVSGKEHDLVASGPVEYDSFTVDTYADYEYALTHSLTELFYAIPTQVKDVELPKLYFTHDDQYHRKENHTFKNICNGEEKYNGIFLCSKYKQLTKRELEHRHIVYNKQWNILVSKHKPYDVVFISYDEESADKHYKELLKKAPHATRVHGVKGIHQAHIQAAKQSTSEMVWIVDADAILMDDFNFELFVDTWDRETVHVWRSKNPINDLVYGYGGVKLFPRLLTINMDTSKPDMTTSITSKFKAVNKISNITAFNVDEFSTWKSAFRECCKLASKIIDRQKSKETEERLDVWCTVGADKLYGQFAILGANAGRNYGYENKDNLAALKLINDFNWLREKYESSII